MRVSIETHPLNYASNQSPIPAGSRRLLETHGGTHAHAFGGQEWALLAAIALIWGASFFFIDVALDAFAPGVIAAGRVALGAFALALWPAARRPVARADLPRVALLGVVWMGIPLMLFPIAQQWIDSSVAGMLNAAVPLAAAAWASLLLGRLPRRNQAIGLVLGFAGVLAISLPELRGAQASPLGIALVLLAVVLYGLSQNLAVPLQQRHGSAPVLLRALLVALVVLAPFALAGLDESRWAWGPALALLPLGLLGTGLAYVLMTTLVGRVGAARGSVAIYFVPIVAIGLGVAFLGERVSGVAVVGTGLVLAGAGLTSRKAN
ncbi:MAG TPA: DMT family transporter [Longimicrobiales bacterium]